MFLRDHLSNKPKFDLTFDSERVYILEGVRCSTYPRANIKEYECYGGEKWMVWRDVMIYVCAFLHVFSR